MDTVTAPARRQAVFFVTDLGFALPTLASALEVRRKIPKNRGDIRVVTTGLPLDTVRRLRDFAAPRGVHVDILDPALYSGFDMELFSSTHVSVATLGRFWMLDAVSDHYDRILYLDGDTWPEGDVLKLLEADLPWGTLGAADDRNYYRRLEAGPVGRRTRAYFKNLEIDARRGYLSCGVLLADTPTWRDLSREAFAYFVKNVERCVYHDQSALNAVIGRRWTRLAPQWNFVQSFMDWGLTWKSPPQILHFAGGDKPWSVPFHPYHAVYAAALAPLLKLGLPITQYTGEKLLALEKRARLRKLRDRLFVHRRMIYQRTFNQLVNSSLIK
jgi:lipopolysaccharide biosynthesis glycosyltransferase